jgi:hypothetical protein
MKILHINGCKAFSIQNINECQNMTLYHNTSYSQPSISSKMKKKTLTSTLPPPSTNSPKSNKEWWKKIHYSLLKPPPQAL